MKSGVTTSSAAPPAETLRTVQSIPPPPNEIVPAFSTRRRGATRCSPMRVFDKDRPLGQKCCREQIRRRLTFDTGANSTGPGGGSGFRFPFPGSPLGLGDGRILPSGAGWNLFCRPWRGLGCDSEAFPLSKTGQQANLAGRALERENAPLL